VSFLVFDRYCSPRRQRRRLTAAAVLTTFAVAVIGLGGAPARAVTSGFHASSQHVLIVDGSAVGAVGALPTQGTVIGAPSLNLSDFSFSTVQASAFAAADLSSFDTVALYQVEPSDLSSADQSRISSFVTDGGKLIIHDSDGTTDNNYNWLPTPATTGTSCPNCGNTGGTATIVENNTLVSSVVSDSTHYVSLSDFPGATDAIGDGNVMVTQNPNWYVDITADNGRGQTGAIHTYASAGSGLMIYDGFDDDYMGRALASGVDWLGKLWFLELAQAWSPDGLPRSNSVSSGSCIGHGAGGWTFSTDVSPNDGLVLDQARFGPRLLARQISVPYFDIAADWNSDGKIETRRAELTPDSSQGHADQQVFGQSVLTTTLLRTKCIASDGTLIGSDATYSVNGLPAGVTMWVQQSYRFEVRTTFCEPSGRLPCARFWPTVTWGVDEGSTHFLDHVDIVQRLHFLPDGGTPSRANIYRDRSRSEAFFSASSVQTLGRSYLRHEVTVEAIDAGRRIQDRTWDSWHQTDRAATSSPGVNLLDPQPGCSECVHIHWAWGTATNLVTPGFTDGKPEILDGSLQTAHISAVKYSSDPKEIDPWHDGYQSLVNNEELGQGNAVLFWETNSPGTHLTGGGVTIDDKDFPLGDAAWPQLDDYTHGGNGAMFFAPARVLGEVPANKEIPSTNFTIKPDWNNAIQVQNALDLRLPAGWVLPVQVSHSCANGISVAQGPFWISVTATNGETLLNPEGPYVEVPRGLPYTLLRTDTFSAGANPQFHPGQPVPDFHCIAMGRGWKPVTYTSYLVFNSKPSADNVSLQLLGAPDGDHQFYPFDEP
jgi:hypothetical protein